MSIAPGQMLVQTPSEPAEPTENHPTDRPLIGLPPGCLRRFHHIALNVHDLGQAKQFYGEILGLVELTGDRIPATLLALVQAGKVATFELPDGAILDLFWEPDLLPPHPDPAEVFTRANHLAFDVAAEVFDMTVEVLRSAGVTIAAGPVTRPTGRGIYVYDPDGFMVELRCDPGP